MWTRLMLWNILTYLGTLDFLPHELKTFHAFVVYTCLSVFNFSRKISFCYLSSFCYRLLDTCIKPETIPPFSWFTGITMYFSFLFFLEHRYFIILLFYYSKLIVCFFQIFRATVFVIRPWVWCLSHQLVLLDPQLMMI